jgi:WD40 repeat protein
VDEGYEAHDAAFSPDGGLLAVTAKGVRGGAAGLHQVYLWETGPVRLRGVVDLGGGFPSVPVFTPDGSRLLVAAHISADPTPETPQRSELRGWRTDDLVESDREDLGAQQAVHLAVGPDGDTLAVAGTNRNVELRSLTGDRPSRTLANHPATVRAVAFSPDGRTLATITTEDDAVRLWDIETGEPVASLAGHVDTPNAVAFSPDGRTLASAGADGVVALWTTDPNHAVARICQALASPSEPVPHPLCTPTDN